MATMFNVGGGELVVIALVALIVLGPEKLPDTMRKLGQWLGELRNVSDGFQAQMRNAMHEDDMPASTPSLPPRDNKNNLEDDPPEAKDDASHRSTFKNDDDAPPSDEIE